MGPPRWAYGLCILPFSPYKPHLSLYAITLYPFAGPGSFPSLRFDAVKVARNDGRCEAAVLPHWYFVPQPPPVSSVSSILSMSTSRLTLLTDRSIPHRQRSSGPERLDAVKETKIKVARKRACVNYWPGGVSSLKVRGTPCVLYFTASERAGGLALSRAVVVDYI